MSHLTKNILSILLQCDDFGVLLRVDFMVYVRSMRVLHSIVLLEYMYIA